jgi:hypothetical protein
MYHAGVGRSVFIGSLKLSTILLFTFSSIYISPSLYYAPEYPVWMAPTALVCGALPMLFVAYTT